MPGHNFPVADFTPQLTGYTGQGAFRFWCQKVLPIVYDDSLSYYELLNKLVIYLNNVINDVSVCEDNIGKLLSSYNLLQKYVNDYFSNLDVQTEINIKLDEMAESGVLGDIIWVRVKPEIDKFAVWADVSHFVDGDLTSDNFNTAIKNALLVSHNLYIPDGEFDVRYTFSDIPDLKLLLSDNCIFRTDDEYSALTFENCSFEMYGGQGICGQPSNDRVYIHNHRNDNFSIVTLENCSNSLISDFKCLCSKTGSVILIHQCHYIRVTNCEFKNLLNSAIHILEYNKNVEIDNCSFMNIKYASTVNEDMSVNDSYYCYAVYTGRYSVPTDVKQEPPDGLIYRNNYVYNSEDSGLDTHGATNVIIENNTVINTVVAITAYNDNRRAARPDDWVMLNVTVQNNFCSSNKRKNPRWSHPFFLLGSAAVETADEDPTFSMGYFEFSNCTVKNNYIKSANNMGTIVSFNAGACRNVELVDNVIDCTDSGSRPYNILRLINFSFTRNVVLNNSLSARCYGSYGVYEDNEGCTVNIESGYSYVKGLDGKKIGVATPQCVQVGDTFYLNNTLRKSATYGVRLIDSRLSESSRHRLYHIRLTNMHAVCYDPSLEEFTPISHRLIPYLAIILTNIDTGTRTTTCYVKSVDTFNGFYVYKAGTALPDGDYTVEPRIAIVGRDVIEVTAKTSINSAVIRRGRGSTTGTVFTIPEAGSEIKVDYYDYDNSYYGVKYRHTIRVVNPSTGNNEDIDVDIVGYMLSTSIDFS